nr:uncharacterized protein LOC113824686 [Penaeus vannamei]
MQASPEKTKLFGLQVELLGDCVGHGVVRLDFDKAAAVQNYPRPSTRKEVQAYLGLTGFVNNYAHIAKPLNDLLHKDTEFQWREPQEEAFNTLKEKLTQGPILQAPDFAKNRVIVWTDNKALQWPRKRKTKMLARWVVSLQDASAEVKFIEGEKNVVADRLSRIKFATSNTTNSRDLFQVELLAACFLEELEEEEPRELGWTPEELRESQRDDPLYGPIVRFLQSKEPTDLEKVDSRLKREIGNYFLDHNLLYKRQLANDSSLRSVENVIVVPRKMVIRVLHIIHSSPLSGHGEAKRTLFRTKRLHLDGNKYILLSVDFLMHYTLMTTLRSMEAEEITSAVWNIVICQWGPSEVILSDQGTAFRNRVMKRLTELGGFQHKTVTIYHPASNGLVENHKKQIISILYTQACDNDDEDGDDDSYRDDFFHNTNLGDQVINIEDYNV